MNLTVCPLYVYLYVLCIIYIILLILLLILLKNAIIKDDIYRGMIYIYIYMYTSFIYKYIAPPLHFCSCIVPFVRKTRVSDTGEQPFNRFLLCRTDVDPLARVTPRKSSPKLRGTELLRELVYGNHESRERPYVKRGWFFVPRVV